MIQVEIFTPMQVLNSLDHQGAFVHIGGIGQSVLILSIYKLANGYWQLRFKNAKTEWTAFVCEHRQSNGSQAWGFGFKTAKAPFGATTAAAAAKAAA